MCDIDDLNEMDLKVSFSNKKGFLKIGDKLQTISVKDILEYCKNLPADTPKGQSGAILAYLNDTALPISATFKCDGTIFTDFDNVQEYAERIYDSFDKICSLIPNLYAVYFSYSGNLHFISYDPYCEGDDIKDKYKEREVLWTAAIAQAVKKTLGIDLRMCEKTVLDTHNSRINQLFFLNHTDYKINPYCNRKVCQTLSKQTITRLKEEYPFLFKEDVISTIAPNSIIPKANNDTDNIDFIKPEHKVLVDANFVINGNRGYMARTVICSAAYFHFNRDINMSVKYLKVFYINYEEMIAQLNSLVRNNHIDKFYNKYVEQLLFPEAQTEFNLAADKYINDVFTPEQLRSRFNYIISNTNTGKTEFAKKLMMENENTYIVQMNKSIFTGKQQGVEQYSVSNWEKIVDPKRVFSTIDGLVKNAYLLDIPETTFILDEAHLLQSYFGIQGRDRVIENVIEIFCKAKKVIFLSATPKQDINLFDFKTFKFIKNQSQKVYIHRCPLHITGKSGRTRDAVYAYIGNEVRKNANMDNKYCIYSDKNQREYKEFGKLTGVDVTLFNSTCYEDENVQSILKDNKIVTPIVLATRFFSVGDEDKYERKMNVVVNLDEGFTEEYLTQCLGRFRVAEEIHLYCYYTRNRNNYRPLTEEDAIYIKNCFEFLNVEDEENINKLNIIAAKGISLFDPNFDTYSDDIKDKIKILKIGNMLDYFNNMSASDLDVLKTLPYSRVIVSNEEEVKLEKVKSIYHKRTEAKLLKYLLSFTLSQLKSMFTFDFKTSHNGYDSILGQVEYDDKVNARKLLECINRIIKADIDLQDAIKYFGDLGKASNVVKMMNDYCKIKRGDVLVKTFEGAEKIQDEIEKNNKVVEMVFTKEFLDKKINNNIIEDDFNFDLLNDMLVMLDMEEEKKSPFKTESYTDVARKIRANKGGRKSVTIKIQNIETKEKFEFASKGDCMNFLNVKMNAFSNFQKGKSRLNKKWKILK